MMPGKIVDIKEEFDSPKELFAAFLTLEALKDKSLKAAYKSYVVDYLQDNYPGHSGYYADFSIYSIYLDPSFQAFIQTIQSGSCPFDVDFFTSSIRDVIVPLLQRNLNKVNIEADEMLPIFELIAHQIPDSLIDLIFEKVIILSKSNMGRVLRGQENYSLCCWEQLHSCKGNKFLYLLKREQVFILALYHISQSKYNFVTLKKMIKNILLNCTSFDEFNENFWTPLSDFIDSKVYRDLCADPEICFQIILLKVKSAHDEALALLLEDFFSSEGLFFKSAIPFDLQDLLFIYETYKSFDKSSILVEKKLIDLAQHYSWDQLSSDDSLKLYIKFQSLIDSPECPDSIILDFLEARFLNYCQRGMLVHLHKEQKIGQSTLLRSLEEIQYTFSYSFKSGSYYVRESEDGIITCNVHPYAESEKAISIKIRKDTVIALYHYNSDTTEEVSSLTIYPKNVNNFYQDIEDVHEDRRLLLLNYQELKKLRATPLFLNNCKLFTIKSLEAYVKKDVCDSLKRLEPLYETFKRVFDETNEVFEHHIVFVKEKQKLKLSFDRVLATLNSEYASLLNRRFEPLFNDTLEDFLSWFNWTMREREPKIFKLIFNTHSLAYIIISALNVIDLVYTDARNRASGLRLADEIRAKMDQYIFHAKATNAGRHWLMLSIYQCLLQGNDKRLFDKLTLFYNQYKKEIYSACRASRNFESLFKEVHTYTTTYPHNCAFPPLNLVRSISFSTSRTSLASFDATSVPGSEYTGISGRSSSSSLSFMRRFFENIGIANPIESRPDSTEPEPLAGAGAPPGAGLF